MWRALSEKRKKSNTPLLSPHPNQESTILRLPEMCLQIWMILCYKRLYIYIKKNSSQQKRNRLPALGVRRKSKNRLNQENWKNNNWKNNNRKNRTVKKNRLNRLKFLKNRPVRFGSGFISLKPNRNEPKPEKNKKNWVKPVWTGFCPKKPNRTETGRFEPVSVFF